MFTDTHAHLSWPDFAADLPLVIERARAAGVNRIVSVATDLVSARETLALAERYDGIHVAVGLHPGELPNVSLDQMPEIAKLAAHPKVVAIGETGLDYYRLPGGRGSVRAAGENGSPGGSPSNPSTDTIKQQQSDLFWAHLGLSKERQLPVVIHSREADADTLEIVAAHAEALPKDWRPWGVMHCFPGDAKMAFECIEAGLLISFTGILTFKNSATMRDVAAKIPLDSVLLETDSPYLTPTPHRGQRNEPSYIPLIAAALAQIKGVSIEEISRVTESNADRLFHFQRAIAG